MSFLSQFFLWGAATLAIPILIHLIFQKRYRRVQWAAMEFLLAAVKKTRNKLQIQNLLLLLIRMAILLLLALAFARPYLARFEAFFPDAAKRSQHVTLVLDRSFSMGYVEGNLSIFDRAKEEARRRIEPLDADKGDTITLVTLEGRPQVWKGIKYSNDFEAVLAEIDAIEVSDAATDVPALVQLLLELAAEDETGPGGQAIHPDKRLAILTDLAGTGWEKGGGRDSPFHNDLLALGSDYRPIEVVPVGPGEPHPPNLVVADLTTSGKVIGVGLPATFVATLRNESTEPVSGVDLGFKIDGNETFAEQDLTIEPGEERGVVFQHQFLEPGPHVAEVVATGTGIADRLVADNRRRVVFDVRDELDLLLVDGDPAAEPYDRATYFVERVLAPESGDAPKYSIIRPRTVAAVPGDLPQLGPDAVILANVRSLDESAVGALTGYVREGGTAIVFLGDRIDPESYNKALHDALDPPFLPARIGKRFFGGSNLDENESPAYIVPVDYEHPALRYFQGNRDLELLFHEALTREFYRLDPDPVDRFDVLAVFNDGSRSPAILERAYGDGRVILFTTSADKRWSFLPVMPVFVPLMHELVLYASHRDVGRRNLLVGQPYLGRYPFHTRENDKARIVPPPLPPEGDGEPRPAEPDEARPESIGEGSGIRLFYPSTGRAGVYRIEFRSVYFKERELGEHVDLVAVNVDPAEGDLERTSLEALQDAYPGVPFHTSEAGDEPISRAGRELWRPLLYAVLALLAFESIVAQRFGRFSK